VDGCSLAHPNSENPAPRVKLVLMNSFRFIVEDKVYYWVRVPLDYHKLVTTHSDTRKEGYEVKMNVVYSKFDRTSLKSS